jgi:hypothetical protein
MTYPAYIDNGGIAASGGATVDVPFPGTVNADDLLLVCVLDADNDSWDTTVPSGWNFITEATQHLQCSVAFFWKRAVGDESGTETFTSDLDAGNGCYGVMARFSGVIDSGTPYDTTVGPTVNGVTQNATIQLGSVDTDDIERLVVAMIGVEDNVGISQASDYTEEFEVTSTLGGDASFSFQTQQAATPGTVPADTCTTGNDFWGTLVLALIPGVTSILSVNVNDSLGSSEALD